MSMSDHNLGECAAGECALCLREENARLTRERYEDRAKVARLEGLILDWASHPNDHQMCEEARRIRATRLSFWLWHKNGWELVIRLLIVLGFVAWIGTLASGTVAAADLTAIDRYYVSSAESLALRYARALTPSATPPSIRVVIVEPADPLLLATTVRGEDGRCVLRMRRAMLRRPDIVAHETCHCVNDYALLTPHGYNRSVTLDDVERMERSAERCTAGLK